METTAISRNPLIAKLDQAQTLQDGDFHLLEDICRRTRRIEAGRDVISEGERPEEVHLVLDGYAFRYKVIETGARSIMAFLIPGDFCDLHIAILGRMDHAIGTLTDCTVVDIPRSTINELTRSHARITTTLWWATLVDEAILREWLVSMGRRNAERQLSHLLCELHVRLTTVGLADSGTFSFPVTQEALADTLGMSLVHVNRVLQQLRNRGLIELKGGTLRIPDVGRLEEFGEFDPSYLHLNRLGANSPRHRV